jgi:hypothetical protein
MDNILTWRRGKPIKKTSLSSRVVTNWSEWRLEKSLRVRNRNNAHLPTIRFGQLRLFGSMNGG